LTFFFPLPRDVLGVLAARFFSSALAPPVLRHGGPWSDRDFFPAFAFPPVDFKPATRQYSFLCMLSIAFCFPFDGLRHRPATLVFFGAVRRGPIPRYGGFSLFLALTKSPDPLRVTLLETYRQLLSGFEPLRLLHFRRLRHQITSPFPQLETRPAPVLVGWSEFATCILPVVRGLPLTRFGLMFFAAIVSFAERLLLVEVFLYLPFLFPFLNS